MASKIKWQIPFAAKDGKQYIINIYKEGYTGTPITLNGGTEPFVTQENDGNDVFKSVIPQTGYISFIDTTGTLVDDLHPSGTLDSYVELTTNGGVVWMGYLSTEEYSGNWGPAPYEVNLPVLSVLEILKQMPFNATGNVRTIGSILTQALDGAGEHFQALIHSTNQPSGCLTWRMVDLLFALPKTAADKRYRGINPNMLSPSDYYSCYDVVDEVCKFFGWSARESGTTISLLAPDSTTSYHYHTMMRLRNGNYTEDGSSDFRTEELVIRGADHNRSALAPMSQIRLTVENKPFDSDVLGNKSVNALTFLQAWDSANISNPSRKIWYGDIFVEDENVKTYQYFSNGQSTTNPQFIASNINAERIEDVSYFGGYAGRDCYSPDKNKSYVVVVSCEQLHGSETDPFGRNAVELASPDIYNFMSSGYLDLDFKVEQVSFAHGEKKYDDDDDDTTRVSGSYTCRMSFDRNDGSILWYNGTGWQSSMCKTLMIQGQIPLPSGCGKFKLHIGTQDGSCWKPDMSGTYQGLKYIRFKELNLTLANTDSYIKNNYGYDIEQIRYNQSMDVRSSEVYKRKSTLCTDVYGAPAEFSYGRVYGGFDPYPGILSRMAAWYGQRREFVKVVAELMMNVPRTRLSVNSAQYVAGAATMHWRDSIMNIKCYKL